MMIGPIEESFAMLNRYQLHYPSTDAERVDGLTYAWKKLTAQVLDRETPITHCGDITQSEPNK